MRVIKRWFWLLPVACGLALAPVAGAAELKIATVSMERLFDEYHRTQSYNADLKKRAAALDAKRDELVLAAKARQRELETLAAEARDRSLSAEEREQKKRTAEEAFTKARDAEEALADFDRTEKRRFSEEMRNKQQELVQEIKSVIHSYVVQNGYTLVLDTSGKTLNSVETIVYADPAMDITEAVLAILNRKGK